MNSTTLLPIRDLTAGQFAVVENVAVDDHRECCRLAELGLCAGALVRMVVPGCPCAVQVGDCRVMLRGCSLEAIHVSVI